MKAIVIVDLQRAFPIPAAFIQRVEERSRQFPVRVFTQFINPQDSLFRRVLDRHSCGPGTAECELVVKPQPGDIVIEKCTYGLREGDVARLRNAHIDSALVCGADTDACVLGVVFSLFDAGIACEVDPSLCWSSTDLHEPAMRIIREQFKTGLPAGT